MLVHTFVLDNRRARRVDYNTRTETHTDRQTDRYKDRHSRCEVVDVYCIVTDVQAGHRRTDI